MIESFGLLLGHLIGDYVVQNDWMAANKTNPHPGEYPSDPHDQVIWRAKHDGWMDGHIACTVHCLCYALAVLACSFWWLPWWGVPIVFLAHWPIDRWRLAGRWMRNVSGQAVFASPPPVGMAPWSVIVVDNTFHLMVLFAVGLAVFRPWVTP